MSWTKHDQELKEELEAHLRMAAQDRVDRGESSAEARANAKREFGNSGLIAEVTRETWGWAGLYRFVQDVRYGARVLRRNPVFAAVAIFTLALGIGATTAIFSVVYGVLLRPLPYDKPEQIVRLWGEDAKANRISFSDVNFNDVRAQSHSFEGLAEYHFGVEAVSGGSEPKRVPVAEVSHDFFTVFAVHPMIGRVFAPEEEKPNGPSAAVVSYAFWKDYLGGQTELRHSNWLSLTTPCLSSVSCPQDSAIRKIHSFGFPATHPQNQPAGLPVAGRLWGVFATVLLCNRHPPN